MCLETSVFQSEERIKLLECRYFKVLSLDRNNQYHHTIISITKDPEKPYLHHTYDAHNQNYHFQYPLSEFWTGKEKFTKLNCLHLK